MFSKYILPMIAIAGVGFSVFSVVAAPDATGFEADRRTAVATDRVSRIAGAGLIEARKENIPIGTTVPGVVVERFVNRNDNVKAGDPLFRIDDRDLKAELKVREANLIAAQAQYERHARRAASGRCRHRRGDRRRSRGALEGHRDRRRPIRASLSTTRRRRAIGIAIATPIRPRKPLG